MTTEKRKIYARNYYRVYMRKYRKEHPDWYRACKRRYRKNNPEKAKEQDRLWHLKNPTKRREIYLRWRDKDPLRTKRQWQLAQAKRRKAGYLSRKVIQGVYENNIKLYGTLTCSLCLKPIEFGQDSIDHRIPLSMGGTHNRDNLEIAHILCNRRKGNKQGVIPIKIEVIK